MKYLIAILLGLLITSCGVVVTRRATDPSTANLGICMACFGAAMWIVAAIAALV